jgi:uncharacterized protein YdeI (YjbR/CyaY-like superfamily)
MITRIEDYFTSGCGRCHRFATPACSTRKWLDGLLHLRRICRAAGLEETAKWGHPCYTHAGRNIAILGAFQSDFRLNFCHAALMTDPQKILRKQGPNTPHPGMIQFTDSAQVTALEPVILAYLHEAMRYAESGIKPPKETHELELPAELLDALEVDPLLAGAFHALTPGRKRSYVIHLQSAKTSATRLARIAKSRPKILAGKGALER